jgi:TrmH family RNA methyltransferase
VSGPAEPRAAAADPDARAPAPPAVLLVRPQEPGNVGAVARAMANMGLGRLLLIEPAAPIDATARAFAVHAGAILDGAERFADLPTALAGFRRVVATTAARDRIWPRQLVTPRELAARLAADPPATPTVLVFGPESSGLTNDELAHASLLVRIPASAAQPTLNLAQAVLVLAYELYVAREGAAPSGAPTAEPPATAEEIAGFGVQLEALLARVGFARDSTIAAVERDLRQLVARAAPTRREVRILRGILRRAGHALDPSGTRSPGGRRSST